MSDKSLGQIAYEAAFVEKHDGVPWENLTDYTHRKWQAAAEAVAMELQAKLMDGVMRELEGRNAILTPEMARVIEAAEEEAENTRRNKGWSPLLVAIEALQKARQG